MATQTNIEQRKIREWPIYLGVLDAVRERLGREEFHNAVRKSFVVDAGMNIDTFYGLVCAKIPGDTAARFNKNASNITLRANVSEALTSLFAPFDGLSTTPTDFGRKLTETGFIQLPNLLAGHEIEELAHYLQSCPISETGPQEHHEAADIAAAPHVLKLVTHPKLLALAGEFLRCAPTIINLKSWWSPPRGREPEGPQIFHRDKDDFRACKFFMYLTDVESDDGPFVYAQSSHDPHFVAAHLAATGADSKWLKSIFDLQYGGRNFAAINEQVFSPLIVEVLGKSGTSFMVNSFGLHRGRPPIRNRRGIIAVTYGMVGYPDRLEWFERVALKELPAACVDTELARHALRLLFAPEYC